MHTISVEWSSNGLVRIEMNVAVAQELCNQLSYVPRSTELGVLLGMLGDKLVKPMRRMDDATQNKAEPESTTS